MDEHYTLTYFFISKDGAEKWADAIGTIHPDNRRDGIHKPLILPSIVVIEACNDYLRKQDQIKGVNPL